MQVSDFILDYHTIKGSKICVQGNIISLGEDTSISDNYNAMSSFNLDTRNLSRDIRKQIMQKCTISSPCLEVVCGIAQDIYEDKGLVVNQVGMNTDKKLVESQHRTQEKTMNVSTSEYTCKVNGENIGITLDGAEKIKMVDEYGIHIGYLHGKEYSFGHGAGSIKITKDKTGNIISVVRDDNVNTYTSVSCFTNSKYNNYYIYGDKIAEGVSLSMVTGMMVTDPKLTYLTTFVHDTLTIKNNTWPLIEVTTKVYSKIIGDIVITYYLLMEQGANNIVGTVKRIKVNGNPKNSLIIMNNKMFIEDDIGTRQVQVKDGKIQIID